MAKTTNPENVNEAAWVPKRARKSDLVCYVTDTLRKEIIEGRFDDSHYLPSEIKLAEMFDVSRPVVRESMRMLRSQGLVEIRQGCRPQVKPIDTEVSIEAIELLIQRGAGSLEDLVEVRYSIECDIAALAAERATPEQVERLAQTVRDLEAANSTKRTMQADFDFHRCLAQCSGNAIYEILIQILHGLLEQSLRCTVSQKGKMCALPWHKAILKAVGNQDAGAARQAMHDHLEGTQKLIIQQKRPNARGKKTA